MYVEDIADRDEAKWQADHKDEIQAAKGAIIRLLERHDGEMNYRDLMLFAPIECEGALSDFELETFIRLYHRVEQSYVILHYPKYGDQFTFFAIQQMVEGNQLILDESRKRLRLPNPRKQD